MLYDNWNAWNWLAYHWREQNKEKEGWLEDRIFNKEAAGYHYSKKVARMPTPYELYKGISTEEKII